MSKVEKLSVALTGRQVEALRSAVEEGVFATTSEAVRHAIEEWAERREARREAALQRVRKLIREGIESGIAPRRRTAAEIHADGLRRLAELKKASKLG